MALRITVDASLPEPVYQQVVRQVQVAVAGGGLKEGAALPPIRQLAQDLEVNPNTVARAYQLLEQAGVVETRGRGGTVVARRAKEKGSASLEQRARQKLERTLHDLAAQGLKAADLRRVIREIMSELPESP